jgi:hypothetical protein
MKLEEIQNALPALLIIATVALLMWLITVVSGCAALDPNAARIVGGFGAELVQDADSGTAAQPPPKVPPGADEMPFGDLVWAFKRPFGDLPITASLEGVRVTESRLTGETKGAVEGAYNSAAPDFAPAMAAVFWERLGWKGGGFDYINSTGEMRPRDWKNVKEEMGFTPQRGDRFALVIGGSKSRSNIITGTVE